jgi:hypothetical protein
MYLICKNNFQTLNSSEFTFEKGLTYKIEVNNFYCDENITFLINDIEISLSVLKNYFVNIETWRDLQIKELL